MTLRSAIDAILRSFALEGLSSEGLLLAVKIKDVVRIKVKSHMRKRAEKLAERKLGYRRTEDGKLVKVGEDNIYKRYPWPTEKRWEKIYLGEMAEEAAKEFMDTLGIEYICYNDCREDDFKDEDPFDFRIRDIRIDLKSSKDNRNHGLEEILKQQHLVTPIDQTVKPIIIQAFISHDEKQVWLTCWATDSELKQQENIGYLHWQPGKYYLLNVKDCHPMSELKQYLKKNL
jgi:hypothetical protein